MAILTLIHDSLGVVQVDREQWTASEPNGWTEAEALESGWRAANKDELKAIKNKAEKPADK